MEQINFEIEKLPEKKRNWKPYIIAGVIILGLILAGTYYYRKYNNATIEKRIDKIKTEQSVTDGKLKAAQQEKADSEDKLRQEMKSAANEAIEINKNSQKLKPIHYEKPIIEDANIDYMRSVLDTSSAK